ncbi:MAG: ImmA/IrrE family metallo-endopeptidase [Oscillospiraceae bacterium]
MNDFNLIYGKYRHCRNAAWQCLIDFNISSVPVQLTPITKKMGIKVICNSSVNELKPNESGVSIFDGSAWYIIYNDSENRRRNRFTIAHELGHILLGHEMKDGYYQRSTRHTAVKPENEKEADSFAVRLLAPACVLWGLNLHSAQEISEMCDISYSAAKVREERMKILYQRNKFLTSPLERQVFSRFEPFINSLNNNNFL